MPEGELYRSDTLLVRAVPGEDRTSWIVSFDHFRNQPGFAPEGFGETFLRDQRLSAIHVLCRDNSWYQYPDTLLACAAIRNALVGAERVVAYGSSMGAYAAIRLGSAIGATATLALSPQYSIDPAKVPWEWRWNQYRDAIARSGWREEIDGPIAGEIIPYITFDPTDIDLRHVERIEQDIRIHRIPLPYTGHPTTGYLGEVDLLRPLLRAVYDGADACALMRSERGRRRGSSFFLGTLAGKQPPCRLDTAIRLAERASVLRPDGPIGHHSLAKLLMQAGRHAEAIAIHRRIAEMTGREAMYLPEYAEALAATGDLQGAVVIATETAGKFPGAAHIHHWHANFLWQIGDHASALAAAHRAVELDPSAVYLEGLRRYEAALEQPDGGLAARLKRLCSEGHSFLRKVGNSFASRLRPAGDSRACD